jgi:hypothetical protein
VPNVTSETLETEQKIVVVVVVDGFCVHNLSALTRSPLLSAGVGGYDCQFNSFFHVFFGVLSI